MNNHKRTNNKDIVFSAEMIDIMCRGLEIFSNSLDFPTIRNNTIYEYGNHNDIDELNHYITKGFINEPKQKCATVTYDDCKFYMEKHLKEAIDNEFCIVAKDAKTKEILGVQTLEDLIDEMSLLFGIGA